MLIDLKEFKGKKISQNTLQIEIIFADIGKFKAHCSIRQKPAGHLYTLHLSIYSSKGGG